MYFLIFILAAYGLTQILTVGSIFKHIRPEHEFFHCSMCVGFWVGILLFDAFWYSGVQLFTNGLVGGFLFGCISSGTSYFLSMLIGDDGLNIRLG